MHDRYPLVGCLLAITFAAPAAPQTLLAAQDQRLRASDAGAPSRFGSAIARGGDVLVVGDPNSRAAYVYERTAGVFVETARLTSGDPTAEFGFGTAVAIDADTIAVGGGLDDGPGGGFGMATAWVFERSGPGWSRTAVLGVPGSDVFGAYSVSLALEGDRLAIGAPLTASQDDRGSVGVFRRIAGVWTLEAQLVATPAQDQDYLGVSVDLDGHTLVAGAYGDDGANPQSGALYVWELVGGAWAFAARLVDSAAPASGGALGWSVAVFGDRIAGGARFDPAQGVMSGAVLTYERAGGAWIESGKVTPADGQAGDWFGFAVDLDGIVLAASAARGDGRVADEGTAYLFTWDGTVWSEQLEVAADNGAQGARFGEALALDDRELVVGAYDAATIAPATGAAYRYPYGPALGTSYCTGGVNSTGARAAIRSFGSPVAANDDLHFAIEDAPPRAPSILFLGPTQTQVPFMSGFLCVGSLQRVYPLAFTDDAGGEHRRLALDSGIGLRQIAQMVPITMNFQGVFRDGTGANLTDGVSILFQ